MWQRLIRHKYLLAFSVFAIWMLFFDHYNMIEQYRLRSGLKKLKEEKAYYLREIENAEKDYNELFTNSASLEKFAREKYLMKKENEDIFVIVEEED
jgi:cell division protein FtsB